MGWHLVNLLVQQLEGELEVAAAAGTAVKVRFPVSGTVSGLSDHGANSYR
jgi:two-component sensor histidine kinase